MVKAKAYVEDRDFVTPDDVRAVIFDVFAHRLILNSKARLNEYKEEQIIEEILREVPMPQTDSLSGMLKKS